MASRMKNTYKTEVKQNIHILYSEILRVSSVTAYQIIFRHLLQGEIVILQGTICLCHRTTI